MYGDGWYESSMESVIFHWTCQKWLWGTQSSYRSEPTKEHQNCNVYKKWNTFWL